MNKQILSTVFAKVIRGILEEKYPSKNSISLSDKLS